MRFYVEGYEIDVQDPRFFLDEEELKQYQYWVQEILEDYYKE